jgi:hypothetical protein
LCKASQFISLGIFSPFSNRNSENPNEIANDAGEYKPHYAMLLVVRPMAPENECEDGKGKVVVAAIWTI